MDKKRLFIALTAVAVVVWFVTWLPSGRWCPDAIISAISQEDPIGPFGLMIGLYIVLFVSLMYFGLKIYRSYKEIVLVCFSILLVLSLLLSIYFLGGTQQLFFGTCYSMTLTPTVTVNAALCRSTVCTTVGDAPDSKCNLTVGCSNDAANNGNCIGAFAMGSQIIPGHCEPG